MKFSELLIAAVLAGLAAACSGRREAPAPLRRIDLELAGGAMPSDPAGRRAVEALFAVSGYGEPSDSALRTYASSPSITVHAAAVDSVFASVSGVEKGLGRIASRLHDVLPGVAVPRFYAIVSPFNQSVIVADTMVFIGLNHYLGEEYGPYGYFPDFIRRRKTPGRLPVDVAEALVRVSRPFTPEGSPTLLQAMLYEGAVCHAVSELTGTAPEQVPGFSPAELKFLADHEDDVWRLMAERKWLYSSDPAVLRSFIALSPAATLLSPDAPGAAGRWTGTRIVSAYLASHPEAKVSDLLSPGFYADPASLRESGY